MGSSSLLSFSCQFTLTKPVCVATACGIEECSKKTCTKFFFSQYEVPKHLRPCSTNGILPKRATLVVGFRKFLIGIFTGASKF